MAVKKSVKKSPVPKKAASAPARNIVPVFVLAIMALSAAFVALLNIKSSPTGTGSRAGIEQAKASAAAAPSASASAAASASSSSSADTALKKMKVFFLSYNEKSGKIIPSAVTRDIKGGELESLFRETVKGPTSAEEKKGMVSALPKNVKVRRALIDNGILDLDLSREFTENAQGDAVSGRVNQLFYTATAVAGVKGLVIRVNGKALKTLGADGLVLSWPMKRPL